MTEGLTDGADVDMGLVPIELSKTGRLEGAKHVGLEEVASKGRPEGEH